MPSTTTAAVRAYEVSYFGGRCFADIQIDGAENGHYCPMVQLAVARYQPSSVTDLSMSVVVKAGVVPLLPTRELHVHRVTDGLQVMLAGTGVTSNVQRTNRVDAFLERLQAPDDVAAESVDFVAVGSDTGGVPAWVRVPGAAASRGLGEMLSVLRIPEGPGRYRLRVVEVERFFSDDSGVIVEPATGGALSERIVFTDIVPLT